MIQLFPKFEKTEFSCPVCSVALDSKGYYIPGMRCLADMHCPECDREFYADLPAGHGLYYPMLLDKETGLVSNHSGVDWFAQWLERSYRERRCEKSTLEIEVLATKRSIVLINCLDKVFGHSVLKLLNAQYYIDNEPDKGVVVLIPKSLRWMVPDGVAEVWAVDQTFRNGAGWNDALAEEIQANIERFAQCWLSPAFSHPHPSEYSIERFTRIAPFPLDEWDKRLDVPKLTFIWRSDRLWTTRHTPTIGIIARIVNKARRMFPYLKRFAINRETKAIVELATMIKQHVPSLDFAVAGFGEPCGLPSWIEDLRSNAPDVSIEKNWCRRYADSHLAIGVCGSNMLLPSAHAGATIDLMPDDKWGNLAQDLLFRVDDQRETLFHYRLIPASISAKSLAQIAAVLLFDRNHHLLTMKKELCDPRSSPDSL
ncbi:MAG: hypothetical protein NT018_00275 [Armatimonadetes bacterium]|nr:hypothetical protein [Armatimonadota bacterium]